MGYASKGKKHRVCKQCGSSEFGSAKELVEHAAICKRVKTLGLSWEGRVELVKTPKRKKRDWN